MNTHISAISNETKLIIGVIISSVILIIGAMFIFSRQNTSSQSAVEIPRSELLPDTTFSKGNASASAYLVEFSDFQCPACAQYAPFVSQLLSTYKDSLVMGYRHYPLAQHPFAEKAAYAAEAAGKQGKFWEYHDKLFQNQEKLSDQLLLDLAKELSLDETTFNTDRESREIKDKVNKDRAAGNLFGVNSTPTFFLNGKKLNLRSGKDLEQAIQQAAQLK